MLVESIFSPEWQLSGGSVTKTCKDKSPKLSEKSAKNIKNLNLRIFSYKTLETNIRSIYNKNVGDFFQIELNYWTSILMKFQMDWEEMLKDLEDFQIG